MSGGLPAAFGIALAALVPLLVFGHVETTVGGVPVALGYKHWMRGLALAWLALLVLPWRASLPYRWHPADLPLVGFTLVAALSVALGGGHWGDVRNLAAAIGVGLLMRTFAPPARRSFVLHWLGALVVLVLARELVAEPGLLRLEELRRYQLVTANPNVLGFLFAMTAPRFAAEACAARGARRAVAGLYAVVAGAGVLVTFSRTAALGLACGALLLALALPRPRRALAWIAVAVGLFLAVQRPDLWSASRRSGDLDRLRIMHASLTLARDHPLLGIGFGINNLEERFPDRYQALYGVRLFRYHSANQVVDLLVGTGIVGTLLAGWWAVRLGRGVTRRWRADAPGPARVRAAGDVAALGAIALMALAEPPLYHGKLLPVLFILLAWGQLPGAAPRAGGRAP